MKDSATEKMTILFKDHCNRYLSTLGLALLRSYGRHIGVAQATEKKKQVLIDCIISILVGETAAIPRSKRGAPVRDDGFNPRYINEEIDMIRRKCIEAVQGEGAASPRIERGNPEPVSMRIDGLPIKEDPRLIRVEDCNAGKHNMFRQYERSIYKGQLTTINRVSYLFPTNCRDTGEKIIVPVELIHAYDLHEGDVITCHAKQSQLALIAEDVLTINDLVPNPERKRIHFDEEDACYPVQRITFYDKDKMSSVTMKYLQWLIPIGRGHRGCIHSTPKAGKTKLLLDIAEAALVLNPYVRVLALLIDQSPETVSQFRKVLPTEQFLYTTYEDAPERQVFVADFLLQRAKSLADSGHDVLVLVDSFNALAHAYNDTDASVGGRTFACGIESKTIHYLKKYFGCARCLEKGGSITMIGALSEGTGNAADDLISAELSAVENLHIQLSDELAVKHIYPTIDLMQTHVKQEEQLISKKETEFTRNFRSQYLAKIGEEGLREILSQSKTYEEFVNTVTKIK